MMSAREIQFFFRKGGYTKMPKFIVELLMVSAFLVVSSVAYAQVPDRLEDEAGSVILKDYERDGELIGQYFQYLPAGTSADYAVARPIGSDPLTIIVLIHGSIGSDADALNAAEDYLNRYTSDADLNWFAIVAPVFNQTDFGGDQGPKGGYRGMVGRHRTGVEPRKTDADGFINGILDEYKHKHPEIINNKALFYGHSAGGQCLSRYLVTHPGRVGAAVISSAGSYPFPDDSYNWTDGMGTLSTIIPWGSAADRAFEFEPAASGFGRAARLPLTVMVGANEGHHEVPNSQRTPGFADGSNPTEDAFGNPNPAWNPTGNGTRHLRGSLWVDDMRDYANLNPGDPGVTFSSLPGMGHSSAQTQPVALPVLLNSEPQDFYIEWLGSAMGPVMMN
jgi:pimeloyl-ACP methyl ester carboxylesterase